MSYIGNAPVTSATRTVTEVTATSGQTVFYPSGGYTVGYVDVLVNGTKLQSADFTATNGSSVTLAAGSTAGDEIRIEAWGTLAIVGYGTFPFYTASGAKDVINLSSDNKLPFFVRAGTASNIALTLQDNSWLNYLNQFIPVPM